MNSPLLQAYKKGTNEYEIASKNYEYGYQQGRKDVWEDIYKIINGMTNPIQTMKIIIEQMKGEQNE